MLPSAWSWGRRTTCASHAIQPSSRPGSPRPCASKDRESLLALKARQSEEASSVDPLTGLGNRRRLEARAVEVAATMGPDAPVGVHIADVDHFKRVNDAEGHLVGDLVLRILAGRLAGAFDDRATLVRWGGEEFLALVPGVAAPELSDLAERGRMLVCDRPFSLGNGRVLEVTVSLGCAVGRLSMLEATLQAADEALYTAKREGRNRVVTAAGL